MDRLRRTLGGIAVCFCFACPARAHNAFTHLIMTDYAYQLMVNPPPFWPNTAGPGTVSGTYAAVLHAAAAKFAKLPSGLPAPTAKSCDNPNVLNPTNSWTNTVPLVGMPMDQVPNPLSADYGEADNCGIYTDYARGPLFDDPAHQDFAGTVLGWYATRPDNGFYVNADSGLEDVHVYVKPLNALGLSYAKELGAIAVAAALAVPYVSVKCCLSCTESFLTFGLAGDCGSCIHDAVNDLQKAGDKVVATATGWIPLGFHDMSGKLYTGLPHHIDNAPEALTSGVGHFDAEPGMLMERDGPAGMPDPMEFVMMALIDFAGVTVHYDQSQMPQRYQIGDNDDSSGTDSRSKDEWEYLSLAHTPMTSVDNLGRYGWERFSAAPTDPAALQWLGWPLHAIGDATVPHHVAGTFGWGHRPFENAASDHLDLIFHHGDKAAATRQAVEVLFRSEHYYDEITSWRQAHPSADGKPSKDIPYRTLVREVAAVTWTKSTKPSGNGDWPFRVVDSAAEQLGLEHSGPYSDPAFLEATSKLIDEGVALEVAFLAAASDLLP